MSELILTSSVLILVMIVVRRVMKGRISLRLQYALWALVFIRLLLPFSLFPSSVSVLNAVPEQIAAGTEQAVANATIQIRPVQNFTSAEEYKAAYAADYGVPISEVADPDAAEMSGYAQERSSLPLMQLATMLWYGGILVVGLGLLLSNLIFYRKLRRTRKRYAIAGLRLPVYVVEHLPSPCLFGIVRPAIYLTPGALEDEEKLQHILAHELTHYRHLDHVWAVLRGVCLAVHWYNPLVWLAAALSRRDAELACDEGAIMRLGETSRIEYGRTLIGLTTEKRSPVDLLYCATTMSAGKNALKERIMLIAKKPKMLATTLIAVILIITLAVGCTFTGTQDENDAAEAVTLYERFGVSIAIPDEYADQILIDPQSYDDDSCLIRVYQKAAYEKHEGMGWLFSIHRYTQAQYEQFLCSDGSGQSFFAKDDTYYYGFFTASDVQTEDKDYEAFCELLSSLDDSVKSDMITRNTLTAYSDAEFFDRTYTYDSAHLTVSFYPYYASNGSKDEVWTLILSQPATQGEQGIWCVERWYDVYGNTYPYFPDENGVAAAEYYADLQAKCDAGERSDLLDPTQVCLDFVASYFEFDAGEASFDFSSMQSDLFAVSTADIDDYMPDLLAGTAVSAYELLPCLENFSHSTWSELDSVYGSAWWNQLWLALRDAVLGDGQSLRDYYLGCAYLAADGAYSEGLSGLLLQQWQADSATYSACLNARFSAEDGDTLRLAVTYEMESFGENPYGITIPGSGRSLCLDRYPLAFPFAFDLSEQSRETYSADTYGQLTVVESDGLQVSYLNSVDGVYYINKIRATKSGYAAFGVSVGDSLEAVEELLQDIPQKDEVDSLLDDGDSYFGAFDKAYVYKPEEVGCKYILYIVKGGSVVGIEIVDGLDGQLYG